MGRGMVGSALDRWAVLFLQLTFLQLTVYCLLLTPHAYGDSLSFRGVVHPWAEATMKSKVHGKIRQIYVREGQGVRKGGILMEFDNDREASMVELSQARLSQARASLEEMKTILLNSRKDLQRKQEAAQVVPRKLLEDAEDLVRQHEASVSAREAEVAQAVAEVKLRQVELEDTRVRTPFDGVVTRLHVEEGEVVKALEVDICQVVALDKLYVEVSLPLDLLRKVRAQQQVTVVPDRVGGRSVKGFKGEIYYINPLLDPTSKTFKVKVRIDSPDGVLRPGMIANVAFPFLSAPPIPSSPNGKPGSGGSH